ncbi:aromatic-ring-hydroxylating dioxygenase subunit beta [Ramlibacter albus]|nr:aromatic-ring-hydroxylating dioxygenase subunit beta [Ramlibacter albus]
MAPTIEERVEVEQFLFEEARLADEARYFEWESLVDDDMLYWVPLGDGSENPASQISITRDNRQRLANRIKQLATGKRPAQSPASPMRRVLSNIQIRKAAVDEFEAGCNFVLYELRVQSTGQLLVWPGRAEYRIRRKGSGLLMFFKKVTLVNASEPLPSLAFII